MKANSVKSAERVLEIVECFSASRQPLRLKQLVETLGYPTSSVAALLKCMSHLGYLHYDEVSRCYSLTDRLANLTNWVSGSGDFEGAVLDKVLRELQRETGELVLLSTENGLHLEYVKAYPALGGGVHLNIPPGTRRLLIQEGAGWLFLVGKPQEKIAEIYHRTINSRLLTEDEFPLSELLKRLDQVHEHDVRLSLAKNSVRPTAHWSGGLISTLVPVPAGHRPLAISIAGLGHRLKAKFEPIRSALLQGRAEIERACAGGTRVRTH